MWARTWTVLLMFLEPYVGLTVDDDEDVIAKWLGRSWACLWWSCLPPCQHGWIALTWRQTQQQGGSWQQAVRRRVCNSLSAFLVTVYASLPTVCRHHKSSDRLKRAKQVSYGCMPCLNSASEYPWPSTWPNRSCKGQCECHRCIWCYYSTQVDVTTVARCRGAGTVASMGGH